jgi:N utilization substance protein B
MRRQSVDETLAAFYESLYSEESEEKIGPDSFMEELVKGTIARMEEIDQLISAHSEHWRIERMAAVDRNILRLAVYEMLPGTTPAAVVIDEALELARKFSNEEAVAFINGVLDALRRERAAGREQP